MNAWAPSALLPGAWYRAKVVRARDGVLSRNGRWEMLEVELRVEGKDEDRTVTAFLPHTQGKGKKTPEVEEIGREKLESLLDAAGYKRVGTLKTKKLVGKKLEVRLEVTGTKGHGMTNRIREFAKRKTHTR